MVYESLDREKQARFATVRVADKTRHFVFVLILIIIQQLQKVFTKTGHFFLRQAVVQNFSEVLSVGLYVRIVLREGSWSDKADLLI